MSSFPQVLHPVPSDRALEVLTNSMWSTMMITGVFFMSFLFVFLSVKVGRSVGVESIEAGPIEISFLLSVSGIRYIYNHVRHHLFETPLLPRRRYSSLSISWFSELLKRASFSSKSKYVFPDDLPAVVVEKTRRNSTQSEHRKSFSSKSKRMSVPHVQGSKSHTSTTSNSSNVNSQQNTGKRASSQDKVITRRNTLPNIALSTELPKINTEAQLIPEAVNEIKAAKITVEEAKITSFLNLQPLNAIAEEEETAEIIEESQSEVPKFEATEPTEPTAMPEIENENLESDGGDTSFEEIISEYSDILLSEEEEIFDENETIEHSEDVASVSISIPQPSVQPQPVSVLESSSPKSSSFRSSYFNYLPESIFGYPTGISKNAHLPVSPPLDSPNAPPGFSKRSVSHDFTNSPLPVVSNEPNGEFNNHQPLYARRRTETSSRIFSDTAKSILPFDWSLRFDPMKRSTEGDSQLPSRTNTASPCLNDLQNTEDLFAPINWNFTGTSQNEELRRNWDILEDEEDNIPEQTEVSKPPASRPQSTSFSSLFDGY